MSSSDSPRKPPTPPLELKDLLQAISNLGKELHVSRVEQTALHNRLQLVEKSDSKIFNDGNSHRKTLNGRSPASGWRPPPSNTASSSTSSESIPRIRIDAPRFSGDDPLGWIFKIQKYFDYFLTAEEERLYLVAMLIDHPASEWFRYYQSNNSVSSWPEFLVAVRQRFDSGYYENYIGSLSKLRQSSSVLDYQTAFETLLNKVTGVDECTLIAMYVAGLKQPVQRELNLRNLSSLQDAFALARELAACHAESAALFQPQRSSWSPRDSRLTSPNVPLASPSSGLPHSGSRQSAQSSRPNLPVDVASLPIVRLTAAQKEEKARKGLYWFCDDKWVPGHRCPRRFLALVGDEDEEDSHVDVMGQPSDETHISADVSSIHSLAGSPSPRSLKLTGSVNGVSVQVLIDGGSSHNFLHPSIAEKLSLTLHPVSPFRVYVGNGDSLRCSYICKSTPLCLQEHVFEIDLYVLPIHDPKVVLGVQ